MEKTYLREVKRIEELRSKFEEGKIAQKDMALEDVIQLSFMYELEILGMDIEIDEKKKTLEEYKERLKNAIEYLRTKNS